MPNGYGVTSARNLRGQLCLAASSEHGHAVAGCQAAVGTTGACDAPRRECRSDERLDQCSLLVEEAANRLAIVDPFYGLGQQRGDCEHAQLREHVFLGR